MEIVMGLVRSIFHQLLVLLCRERVSPCHPSSPPQPPPPLGQLMESLLVHIHKLASSSPGACGPACTDTSQMPSYPSPPHTHCSLSIWICPYQKSAGQTQVAMSAVLLSISHRLFRLHCHFIQITYSCIGGEWGVHLFQVWCALCCSYCLLCCMQFQGAPYI